MIKQYYAPNERPNVHVEKARENCTCEHCCFIRDEDDDRRAEEEYSTAKYMGKPVFEGIAIGDKVEYYRLPYADRNAVYSKDLEYVKEKAEVTFRGKVISKTEYTLEVLREETKITHKLGFVECWSWGLNKIN